MNQTTITINAELSVRLSVYQSKNGLSSWEEAIAHLLDTAKSPRPNGAVPVSDSAQTETRHVRNLQIVYFGETGEIREEEFKQELLKYKNAYVRIHRTNGESTDHRWRANNITETSIIRGNLMTGYLRGWREKGICKAEVAIVYPVRNAP